jgi:lipopolysaccharide transport system permease protein
MYPMSRVPEKWRFFYFLNPMAGILDYSRHFLIGLGSATQIGYCYVLAISLLFFLVGFFVFKSKEAEMTEDL